MLQARVIRLEQQPHAHAHGHHQLVLALSGSAQFEIDGRGGQVCPLRACVVPGDAIHEFAGSADNRMLILDLIPHNGRRGDAVLLQRLFEAPRYTPLDSAFQHLLRYAEGELTRYAGDPQLTRAIGGVLLHALHARLFDSAAHTLRSSAINCERLDAYIEMHLSRRISVLELAQVMCLSPSHFHAQFKDCMGMTPHQYLLQKRLDLAVKLLRETQLPLVRIAEECGFSSQSALTTAMRRTLGLTPRRMRCDEASLVADQLAQDESVGVASLSYFAGQRQGFTLQPGGQQFAR